MDQICPELAFFSHTLYHTLEVVREAFGLAALARPDLTRLTHLSEFSMNDLNCINNMYWLHFLLM